MHRRVSFDFPVAINELIGLVSVARYLFISGKMLSFIMVDSELLQANNFGTMHKIKRVGLLNLNSVFKYLAIERCAFRSVVVSFELFLCLVYFCHNCAA